jgi:hypothetical protein
MNAKPFTFVVAFTVDPTWIADGFSISDDRAKHMLALTLRSAHGSEIGARVIGRPDPLRVATVQGYNPGHPARATCVAALREETLHGGLMQRALAAAIEALQCEDAIPPHTKALKLLRELQAVSAPSNIPEDY